MPHVSRLPSLFRRLLRLPLSQAPHPGDQIDSDEVTVLIVHGMAALIFSFAAYLMGAIVLVLVIIGMVSGAMALSLTLSGLVD